MAKSEILVVRAGLYLLPAEDTPPPSEVLIEAVGAVNGRASAFTTEAAEIVEIAVDAERLLDRSGIPVSRRSGAEVEHRGAGPSAAAYKHSAKVTVVRLRRRSTGWYLVRCEDNYVHPRTAERLRVILTETQAEIVAAAALKPFDVARPVGDAAAVAA